MKYNIITGKLTVSPKTRKAAQAAAKLVPITAPGWKLVHASDRIRPAHLGDYVVDFRDNVETLIGATPPRNDTSTGRVETAEGGSFYPSVFGLCWVPVAFIELDAA